MFASGGASCQKNGVRKMKKEVSSIRNCSELGSSGRAKGAFDFLLVGGWASGMIVGRERA
jgi:hypothetical protein